MSSAAGPPAARDDVLVRREKGILIVAFRGRRDPVGPDQ